MEKVNATKLIWLGHLKHDFSCGEIELRMYKSIDYKVKVIRVNKETDFRCKWTKLSVAATRGRTTGCRLRQDKHVKSITLVTY